MVARNKFVAMSILLILVFFPPSQASENCLMISLDAVTKPFSEHELSYPKETVKTYTRGVEYLSDDTGKEENKHGRQKQYPLLTTYRTKLSINSDSGIYKLSQRNATGRMNEEQKFVKAVVDISSPIVWMQGTAPLNLASDYGDHMNSSCRPSDFPR